MKPSSVATEIDRIPPEDDIEYILAFFDTSEGLKMDVDLLAFAI